MVKVTPRHMELDWLRPGTDFRPYAKLIVDPTQVAFQPQWFKDYNYGAALGNSNGQTTFIITAGQAALIVEVRDSTTNALLGRVADRRATQDMGRQLATSATSLYDFRQLFSLWTGICTTALGELKSVSPVPKDLQPNQRLCATRV